MTKPRKRLEALQEQFPGKQINRLVSTTQASSLSLSQRIVLSCLMYRATREGKNIAISIRRISQITGLHRDTISRALRQLEEYRLVACHRRRWVSNKAGRESNPQIFGWMRRASSREIKNLAYNYYLQPAPGSSISIVDSLIFVADLFDPGKSVGCLAGRFHLARNTIKKSRQKLASLEMSSDWFADIEFNTKKKPPQPASRNDFLAQFADSTQRNLVLKMLKAEIPWSEQEIDRFFKIAKDRHPDEERFFQFVCTLMGTGERSFENLMRTHYSRPGKIDCGLGFVLYKHNLIQKKA